MYKLLLILLLVGCSSDKYVSTITDDVGDINSHTVAIDSIVDGSIKMGNIDSLPTIKDHTEKIRAKGVEIKEKEKSFLEEIADLKDTSFFRKVVPWIPVALGVICLVIGYMTKDIEDTVAGVVLCVCGVVLNQYWAFIGFSGLIIMLIFGVGWLIVSYDWKKVKKKVEDL